MDHKGQSMLKKTKVLSNPSVSKAGLVEGKPVSSILLDTGCSRTLVRKDLVPQHKLLHREAVAIRCAHGDTVLYPLPEVDFELDGYPLHIEAAISDTVPMPVLLGTDVPELKAFLTGDLKPPTQQTDKALVVTTRAMAKKQQEEGAIQAQKEKESGAQPHKKHLTRKQKREQRLKHQQRQKDSRHSCIHWISQCPSSETSNRKTRLYNKSDKQQKAIHPQQGLDSFREMDYYTRGRYCQDN